MKVSIRAVFWFGVSSCFHGREFPFLTRDKRKKKKKKTNTKRKKNHPALNFCQKIGIFPFLFWLLAAPNCSQWKKMSVWKCCWPPPRSAAPGPGLAGLDLLPPQPALGFGCKKETLGTRRNLQRA